MKKLVTSSLLLALTATAFTPFSAAASGQNTTTKAPATYETTEVTTTVDSNSFQGVTPTPINQNGVINVPTSSATTGGPTTRSVQDPGGGGGSAWTYGGTSYYDQKVVWTTMASAASAIGIKLKIPTLGISGVIGNWIIANKGSWVYIRDVKMFRMAGATLQIQHNVSYFKNSSMTQRIGSTVTYITNDNG
jgi:hypothetical protein